MASVEVPQTLGQLNATPVLEVENFTNWKKRFMCHIIGIEPQFKIIISNGRYILMEAGKRKPYTQWTHEERKAANSDQGLKSLIMSVLLDDQINFFINYLTVKSIWDDLILYHEGTSDVKESRVMDLKLCYNTFKFKEDFQDSPDDEEDTRSSQECMNDLEKEYQERALLAKSKRFFKRDTQRFSSAKATDQTECHKCNKKGHFARDFWSKTSVPKYNKVKAKLALLISNASAPSSSSSKNKGLIDETYDWDEEEVSSDDNDTGKVPLNESHRNTTDHSVVVSDSLATDYDSLDESSVCSTLIPPLKKLTGAKLVFGPKTIKSILNSKSTFKAETLKHIIIKEPSSAPARGNKVLQLLKLIQLLL
nr:retrovirus-related Pol polyprotein from transposon TNT 1-94 [Tanacetum cinerariifolium]